MFGIIRKGLMRNIFSVDVEDYFHPSELERAAPRDRWPHLPPRVADSTRCLLDLLAAEQVRATFFILGWVAQREPGLVRDIAAAGHEVACHSFWHRLVYSQPPAEFRRDTADAVKAIEDACGVTPRAYRAPSYSVRADTMWALDILCELGFTHDSSVYPIVHDRYGIPGFPRHLSIVNTPSGSIHEIPPATVLLRGGRVAPVGGGGYLRLLPYRYTAAGLRRVNAEEQQPACIYLHPWEVDPGQPRIAQGRIAHLRTYLGLNGMEGKVTRLLREFEFGPMCEITRPQ
jgi:polysaccharide deacetylase family protein (PEP-CTERM system associated)